MDHLMKARRKFGIRRPSELIALMAISTTLFLFIHTRDLNTRLKEMQVKLQPSIDDEALSSNQLSLGGGSALSSAGHSAIVEIEKTLRSTGEMYTLNAHQLNNTRNAGQNIVFFNRVPKVGSQTFMELLRLLSLRNRFGFHRDRVQRVETVRLAPIDQVELIAAVSALETPSVFIKHVCYTNFTLYGLPAPIYFNMVRDPIERVISWYYYVRAPWYLVERKQAFPDLPLPDPQWLKKDFETCVLRGDRECTYLPGEVHEGIGDHRRQSLFFCGHEDACLPFNADGALERAKLAVEKSYAVVGVLEDLNSTLTVLEHYIPRFFDGATDVFWNEVDKFNKINKNVFKPPVSEEIKDIVRRNFTKEIEFYQFCRQRLHKQLLALRLNN